MDTFKKRISKGFLKNKNKSKNMRRKGSKDIDALDDFLNESVDNVTKRHANNRKSMIQEASGNKIGIYIPSFDSLKAVSFLGKGAYGDVFLVTSSSPSTTTPTEHYYAIKMLDKQMLSKAKAIDNIFAEKMLHLTLHHPNIIRLFATYQDTNSLYFLMEYAPGGTILTHLKRNIRFDSSTARFIASQLVLALEYLHSYNVVFRDLKPENILIDESGYIKICDFGFAKDLSETMRTYSLSGTPNYMAPEIVNGQAHSFAADWWSLGVVLWELYEGSPLFIGNTPHDVYQAILKNKIQFTKNFPKPAIDLIAKFLTRNPEKRLIDVEKIKSHRFFQKVDFHKVAEKQFKSPLSPSLKGHSIKTNFPNSYAARNILLPVFRSEELDFSSKSQSIWSKFDPLLSDSPTLPPKTFLSTSYGDDSDYSSEFRHLDESLEDQDAHHVVEEDYYSEYPEDGEYYEDTIS